MNQGLSFIIRAKNEEKNVKLCLNSLVPLLSNPRIEIVFVDNNSTDDTYLIAKRFSQKYENILVYKYPINVARCGQEHQIAVSYDSKRTISRFYNWCLDKATKCNIIKWDADFIANIDNLKDMIQRFKLDSRLDRFSLWCTGQTLFIHNDQIYRKNNSYYDEFRVFSKYHGFQWENSDDRICEISNGHYFVRMPILPHIIDEYTCFLQKHSDFLTSPENSIKSKCDLLNEFGFEYIGNHIQYDSNTYDKYYRVDDNFIVYHNWYTVKDDFGNEHTGLYGYREIYEHPVFYELKRTNNDEFQSRTSLIDDRDKTDKHILDLLSEDNIDDSLITPFNNIKLFDLNKKSN